MSHAEKCPVCGGRGRTETVEDHGTIVRKSQPCHGCDGKGWVEVGSEPVYPYGLPPALPRIPIITVGEWVYESGTYSAIVEIAFHG